MSQPIPYNRIFNFTNIQASVPATPKPGLQLDAEYNAIKTTLDGTLANLL
jgi:hypothetical protein